MSRLRANSSPDLIPMSTSEDHALDGITANVKLLLKLLQDHNEASTKDNHDRKVQRVAAMMSILDDVKTRMQKSQSVGKKREAELRRCNTDLRPLRGDKKPTEPLDEKQKLQRELHASTTARKRLEMMCSSLGKEKEIMASELARKAQELNGMEELINDLKAQNETLLAKVKVCAAEHKEQRVVGGETMQQGSAALLERNKALSEQLLRSLEGYRSLKRKFRQAQEENAIFRGTMEEMGVEATAGLNRIHSFKQRISAGNNEMGDIEDEISALEHAFQQFELKISKHEHKKTDQCAKPKAEVDPQNPAIVA